jgi:hypothetical protein
LVLAIFLHFYHAIAIDLNRNILFLLVVSESSLTFRHGQVTAKWTRLDASPASCFPPTTTINMSSPLSSPSRKASLKPYSPSPRSSNINSSDIDMDAAFPDNINANSTINTTPNTSTSSTGASDQQKRAVAEVIAESFPPFDHQAAVVGPFEAEQKRDEEFREGEYF